MYEEQPTKEFAIFEKDSRIVKCMNSTCQTVLQTAKYSFMTVAIITVALGTTIMFFEIWPLTIPPIDIVVNIPP